MFSNAQKIRFSDIAKQLFVSRNYLSQLFKKVTGETFVLLFEQISHSEGEGSAGNGPMLSGSESLDQSIVTGMIKLLLCVATRSGLRIHPNG
ncbi:AraC family transcriptional regulator [Paenibacillus thalictri]|uniref:AraC family transcriptional regulator n=1 Tax=Paenibacillus thalictri TaxID=2527873 RepID=UPI003B82F32F